MMQPDPDFEGPRPKLPPRRIRPLLLIAWAVGIFALLIAMMLPARRSAREPARRAQCIYNLKQIALALHQYEATYGTLPHAWTEDARGRRLHSWRTLILPFLEEEVLYRKIDLAKPWDDPANAAAHGAALWVFRCPGSDVPPNSTTYLAIVGPDACFRPDRPRRLADLEDDHGGTLMVIEAGPESAVHWMAPRDADASLVLGIGSATRLDHPGGTNAAFLDGSVRFLRDKDAAAELRPKLSIPAVVRGARGPDRRSGNAE